MLTTLSDISAGPAYHGLTRRSFLGGGLALAGAALMTPRAGRAAATDLDFASALDAGRAIRAGQVSSVELTTRMLDRNARFNSALNAIVTLTAGAALTQARAADEARARGEWWGPFHGVPCTIIEPHPDRRPPAMDYADYQHLAFEQRPNGVVLVTINRPEVLNATNDRLHWELTQIWLTLDADARARVAVVTGAGRAFSAGGDLAMVDANSRDPKRLARTMREASDIVYNMINLDKPVISAINGVAVGAGLVVALLSDISIMSIALEMLTFMDEDVREGAAAIREKRAPRFPSAR